MDPLAILIVVQFILLIILGVGSLMMISEQSDKLLSVTLDLELFRDTFKRALVLIREDQKETDARIDLLQREVHTNYFELKDTLGILDRETTGSLIKHAKDIKEVLARTKPKTIKLKGTKIHTNTQKVKLALKSSKKKVSL